MPRIDPITGCSVLTEAEMWERIAKSEGLTAEEVMEDFYGNIQQELDDEEALYRTPEKALEVIHGAWKDWCENEEPEPLEVVEVTHVGRGWPMARSVTNVLQAMVRCADGVVHRITVEEWSDGGSRLEPPDGEVNVLYEEVG